MIDSMENKISFLLYVCDGCQQCLAAMSLLEYYELPYKTKSGQCGEWPTLPAIYFSKSGDLELLGGYDQLISFIYEIET